MGLGSLVGIVLLYNPTPLLRNYRFFGFSPICSAYRRFCNFVLTSSPFGHSPYATQGERLRSISLLPCFDFKLRYPVMLRDMAGERCTKPFLFWNKKCRSSSSTVFLQRKNIGEVSRSDGGVNSYSQKVYEIFSTLLLRDYCIFGLSPISLPQLLVMLRDTTGKKEKFNPFHSLKFMFTPTDSI